MYNFAKHEPQILIDHNNLLSLFENIKQISQLEKYFLIKSIIPYHIIRIGCHDLHGCQFTSDVENGLLFYMKVNFNMYQFRFHLAKSWSKRNIIQRLLFIINNSGQCKGQKITNHYRKNENKIGAGICQLASGGYIIIILSPFALLS